MRYSLKKGEATVTTGERYHRASRIFRESKLLL